mmetsp:Transcript_40804/g.105868  ORF Transcript_40804/g.105868 Transcript_40804/m.105868 type:complete len:150 (-) Transcript_40804:2232-2681(-)
MEDLSLLPVSSKKEEEKDWNERHLLCKRLTDGQMCSSTDWLHVLELRARQQPHSRRLKNDMSWVILWIACVLYEYVRDHIEEISQKDTGMIMDSQAFLPHLKAIILSKKGKSRFPETYAVFLQFEDDRWKKMIRHVFYEMEVNCGLSLR